jgi:Undecaprenyl-phosphate galactose phosphotransferase WbaP
MLIFVRRLPVAFQFPTSRNAFGEDSSAAAYPVAETRTLDSTCPDLLDDVLAKHTATRDSESIRKAYAMQALRTGLPLLLVDLITTNSLILFACYFVNCLEGEPLNPGIWNQLPVVALFQSFAFALHQLYPGAGVSPVDELRGIVRSTVFTVALLATVNLVLGQLPRVEFFTFALGGVLVSVLLPFVRSLTRKTLASTNWWGIRLLLWGSRRDCITCFNELAGRRMSGLNPIGYVCPYNELEQGEDQYDQLLVGSQANVVSVAKGKNAAAIGIATSRPEPSPRLAFEFPCVIWFGYAELASPQIDISNIPTAYTYRVNSPFLKFIPRFIKRLLDIAICTPALLAFSPLMLLIAIAIKLLSPGPVFYASMRVGQYGEMIRMWKFRTMIVDSDDALKQKLEQDSAAREEWSRDQKLRDDPRILPVIGSLLRKWSLDELPQLWNVLKGEMSLVGPRPVPADEIVRYSKHYYEYTQMLPGITGLWQISGRNETSFETRVFLVHHYAANWSLWLDAWILLKTPSAVLTKRGAY